MTKEQDQEYYSRRAREQRILAEQCTDPSARRRQFQLVDQYEKLAQGGYAPDIAPRPLQR